MSWGIGKKRTKLGKFLDSNGLEQKDLERVSKVSKNTISKACNDKDYIPTPTIMKKIINAIRKVKPNAKPSDFWDIDM